MTDYIATISLYAILPELAVLTTAVVVLFFDLFVKKIQRINITLTTSLGLLAAYVLTRGMTAHEGPLFGGMIVRDELSIFLSILFLIGALLVTLISHEHAKKMPRLYSEYTAMLLFSTLGMMIIAASADLITLFVGVELLSLSLMVLAGTDKRSRFSSEASMKYLLLGAFSTGFLVYGMAFIYGVCRTTNLIVIGEALVYASEVSPLLILGFALVLVGLGFKISLVPFHMWAPDVYQGAPTPVTAWIATGSKIAGFVALIRIFAWPGMSFGALHEYWVDGLWWLAMLTMVVGNLGALAQTDIKRMLAYSSIAHGGYIAMAFVAHTQIGLEAMLFYLEAYLFMSIGAFGVVIAAGRNGQECRNISDLSGLAKERPYIAKLMVVFMLSLAGMPGTAGFVGKLWLFGSAIQAGYWGLALIGVLTTMFSFYYYLRVIVYMYIREPEEGSRFDVRSTANSIALTVSAACLIILGVFPNLLWDAIRTCTAGV